MEEEKKKLDEEYFLDGYSQYENEEEIKKEEEEIKKTKQLIEEEEEKKNKTKLNKEQDFENIYKNFYFKLNKYNNFYNFEKSEAKAANQLDEISSIAESIQKKKENKQTYKREDKGDNESYDGESKKEVNVNVIFVRISNSTVIGKTKNIKEKIKKKWIYSHQKEIKFYEIILSTMLNENIYYKDIPYVELYSLNYETQKLYDFFNSVNTNLKHSFIHQNKVYDVFNNVVNGQMDVYNFGVFDCSKFKPEKNEDNKQEIKQGEKQKEDTENDKKVNQTSIWQDEDIIIEEMNPSIETDEEKNYQLVFDQHSEMLSDKNVNKQQIDNHQAEEKEKNKEEEKHKENKENKITKDKSYSFQYNITSKKPNKKERSKYEPLFKQKYTNIFINNLKDKLQVERINSIPNFDYHANFTIDTFKDLAINTFFKKYNWEKNAPNKIFDVDGNYIYYNKQKIPKDLFPFFLQLSLAFKFEHTSLLINAPKKIKFQFRNV